MIYRPFTDWEGVEAGLWWSDNPHEDVSPRNPHKKMGLDKWKPAPLTNETVAFIERYWAVARGKIEKTGDVFQDFQGGDIVVSDRVADVIERLEPEQHDLIPIPNVWSLGSQQRVDRQLYFLNVYAEARTVDLEGSQTANEVRGSDGMAVTFLISLTPETSVVFASAADGRHLWRDDVTKATFMSETMVAALKEADVRGFRFKDCTVISH